MRHSRILGLAAALIVILALGMAGTAQAKHCKLLCGLTCAPYECCIMCYADATASTPEPVTCEEAEPVTVCVDVDVPAAPEEPAPMSPATPPAVS